MRTGTISRVRAGLLAGLTWGVAAGATAGAEESWRPLWNGRDLAGWTTWLARPQPTSEVAGLTRGADGKYAEPIGANRDPLKVFTVVEADGRPAVRISGEIFGELRTVGSFSNYRLRAQFKWGAKQWPPRTAVVRDSGLLYHVHSEPNYGGRTWPRSPEFQVQERDLGDLYAIGMQIYVRARQVAETPKRLYQYDPAAELVLFHEQKPIGNRCIKRPDNERPTGEWNSIELVCLNDGSIHVVNGQVVMRLERARRIDADTPRSLTSGQILLQSEGAEVFYRDLEIRPVTAIPVEFAPPASAGPSLSVDKL